MVKIDAHLRTYCKIKTWFQFFWTTLYTIQSTCIIKLYLFTFTDNKYK